MKAYAIKDPKGNILKYTLNPEARMCKKGFTDNWKLMYNLGYRYVPVEITEIKK